MCEIPFPLSMMQTHRLSKSPSHAALLQPCADSFSHRECDLWQRHCCAQLALYLWPGRKRSRGGGQTGNVSAGTPVLLVRGCLDRQLSVFTSSLEATHFRVPILAWLLLTLGCKKEVPIILVIPTAVRVFVFEIMLCSLGSKICFSRLISPQATGTWAHGPCLLLHL